MLVSRSRRCGPCKFISPVFESVAEAHPDATFLKVDVDDFGDVAGTAGVTAMPTFQFWKSGTLVDTMIGADPDKLKSTTELHA